MSKDDFDAVTAAAVSLGYAMVDIGNWARNPEPHKLTSAMQQLEASLRYLKMVNT